MKVSKAFPSKYLKAADLEGSEIHIMSEVRQESLNEKEDEKNILYFKDLDKGLVLNKTNANTIAKAYGDEMDDWNGQEIVLFEAMVTFGNDTVPGIRVRAPQPKDRAHRIGERKPKLAQPDYDDDGYPIK